jgi:hypothetical protein
MRVINQQVMNLVFEVTDELEIDREAITVPLLQEGEGEVRRTAKGKIEIVLPDVDDLGPFLAGLPGRLRELAAMEA